jgi:hypothetical protein
MGRRSNLNVCCEKRMAQNRISDLREYSRCIEAGGSITINLQTDSCNL